MIAEKTRVYLLAKKLGLDTANLLSVCSKLELDVNNQLSPLDSEQVELIMIDLKLVSPKGQGVMDDATVRHCFNMKEHARIQVEKEDCAANRLSYVVILRMLVDAIAQRLLGVVDANYLGVPNLGPWRVSESERARLKQVFESERARLKERKSALDSLQRLVNLRNARVHLKTLVVSDRDLQAIITADKWLSELIHSEIDPRKWPSELAGPPFRQKPQFAASTRPSSPHCFERGWPESFAFTDDE